MTEMVIIGGPQLCSNSVLAFIKALRSYQGETHEHQGVRDPAAHQ